MKKLVLFAGLVVLWCEPSMPNGGKSDADRDLLNRICDRGLERGAQAG